jgi:hypothetical protein
MPERNRISRVERKHRKGESFEYRLLMAVSFTIFLIAAIVSRVLPTRQRVVPGAQRRSVIDEARAAAETCVPFAFMG